MTLTGSRGGSGYDSDDNSVDEDDTRVDVGAVWQRAVVGDDGMSIIWPLDDTHTTAVTGASTTKSGNGANKLSAVRRVGGADLTRISPECPLPCGHDAHPQARPNVYMFGDGGMNWARVREQKENFDAWYSVPSQPWHSILTISCYFVCTSPWFSPPRGVPFSPVQESKLAQTY